MGARDAIRTVYIHKVYNLRSKLGSFGMLREVTEIALHVWSVCACKEARASRAGSGTSCNQAGPLGSGQTCHTLWGALTLQPHAAMSTQLCAQKKKTSRGITDAGDEADRSEP